MSNKKPYCGTAKISKDHKTHRKGTVEECYSQIRLYGIEKVTDE